MKNRYSCSRSKRMTCFCLFFFFSCYSKHSFLENSHALLGDLITIIRIFCQTIENSIQHRNLNFVICYRNRQKRRSNCTVFTVQNYNFKNPSPIHPVGSCIVFTKILKNNPYRTMRFEITRKEVAVRGLIQRPTRDVPQKVEMGGSRQVLL